MSQLLALLRLDVYRVRNWFMMHAGTKILVIFGFLLILFFIVVVEFFLANIFFSLAASQKEFGKAVAHYSINSAILVLFLLSIMSSFAASSRALFRPAFLRFLHSVPISSSILFASRLLSALSSSAWLIVIFLTPLFFAYGRNFPSNSQFILRSLTALLLLALSSHAIGSTLTVIFVKKFGKVTNKIIATAFVGMISGSLLLMRFLFPPSFFRLYYAADWPEFQNQLGQLPLLSTYLPTNWLASTITDNWSIATFMAFLVTAFALALALWIGKLFYLDAWRAAHKGNFLAGVALPNKKKVSSYPYAFRSPFVSLLINEYLSVFRSSAEMGYLAFLSGLAVTLLFLIRNIPALSQSQPSFVPAVKALSLVGLSYLFMTLSARFVYPLIAREKRTSWFLFSVPVKRTTILYSKMVFAINLAILSIIIGLAAGLLAKFTLTTLIVFVLLLFIITASVSLTQLLLGTISPNFAESDNLEATSTSGSGLAAIGMSLLIISLVGIFFYGFLVGLLKMSVVFFMSLTATVLIVVPLGILARYKIYNYEL